MKPKKHIAHQFGFRWPEPEGFKLEKPKEKEIDEPKPRNEIPKKAQPQPELF